MKDDVIYRQAAIDILMKEWKAYKDYPYVSNVRHGLEIAIAILENKVPSAQPDVPDRNVGDMINRQAAIDKIREVYEYEFPTASGAFDEFVTVIIPNLLRNLPSAQRIGRWIWDDEGYHCSECFYHAYGNNSEIYLGEFKFCPNCGCAMEGEEE